MDARKGPSEAARAFVEDPANRDDTPFDLSLLPARRAEGREEALANAPGICDRYGVTTAWQTVAERACLEVTPDGGAAKTSLLCLFGGGFVAGGPLEDLQIIAPLAAGTGMRVIAPSYRLAPEHPYPAGLEDARAVAEALSKSGPYQISGESAGGNLTLCTAQWIEQQGLPKPSALAVLSPAADMSESFDPSGAPDDPTLTVDYVTNIPDVYANGADREDPQISPVLGTFGPDWPDTIITTGTRDRFLGQCARLERAIRDAGGHADLRVWDGLWHVFEYYPEIPEAAVSLDEIAAFLKTRAEV